VSAKVIPSHAKLFNPFTGFGEKAKLRFCNQRTKKSKTFFLLFLEINKKAE